MEGSGSRGRGNGLEAAAYVPLADLDPRLADALLGALRDAGIAAYATPSTGRRGGYLEVQLPSSPQEQVWVDAGAETGARVVLAGLGGEGAAPPGAGAGGAATSEGARPPAPTEEESWQAIVAMFDAAPTGPVPPWPAVEDVPAPPPRRMRRTDPGGIGAGTAGTGAAGPGTAGTGAAGPPPAPGPGSGAPAGRVQPPHGAGVTPPGSPVRPPGSAAAAGPPAAGDTEDHFVPPPPPPLPRTTPATRYGLLALVGGILVLVVPTLLGSPPSALVGFLAVLSVLGGFASLVLRMRDAPPTDSGPDDGAVV